MTKKKLLVNGCSYTAGQGLDFEKQDSNHYANVLINSVWQPDSVELSNIAVPGQSNEFIFQSTCQAILNNEYDIVFVAWTSYPRYNFFVDFGTSPDHGLIKITPSVVNTYTSARVNFDTNSAKQIQHALNFKHEHYHILDVLRWSSILKALHNKVFFINCLLPWDSSFFDHKHIEFPADLSKSLQNLLDIDSRPDAEVLDLYKKMQNDHSLAMGGPIKSNIFWQTWLNPWQGMNSLRVDNGNDNQHPGPITHRHFGESLACEIKTRHESITN